MGLTTVPSVSNKQASTASLPALGCTSFKDKLKKCCSLANSSEASISSNLSSASRLSLGSSTNLPASEELPLPFPFFLSYYQRPLPTCPYREACSSICHPLPFPKPLMSPKVQHKLHRRLIRLAGYSAAKWHKLRD